PGVHRLRRWPMSFGISVGQVAVMFLLMGLGFLAFRLRWVGDEAVSGMTKLVVYFVTPGVIVMAFQRPFDMARLQTLGVVFGLDILVFSLTAALAALVFSRRFIPDDGRRTVLQFGTTYTNAGFLGIPLAQALLGSDGVFYVVSFVVTFHLFVWTHGAALFGRGSAGSLGRRLLELVLNPNMIATAIGMACFLGSWQLPALLGQAVGHVAAMNTPLSMIVVGANLAAISMRSVFRDRDAWLGTLARNLIVPLVFVAGFALLPLDPVAKMATLIAVAAPVGAFVVMFSILHGRDTRFATRLLTVSTLASIVTMPLILAVAAAVW
ncbi:MAG: AEC family transporter, partial [Propionibacteriaceae bacterium]|nr:AEC family transporter [Propionibacteriaceae bacterium]